MVAAPGRVSTMTGWPQFSVIFCPITRARMSVDPPGANGTMILIGFSGYLSAADCARPAGRGECQPHSCEGEDPSSRMRRTVRPNCSVTFLSLVPLYCRARQAIVP